MVEVSHRKIWGFSAAIAGALFYSTPVLQAAILMGTKLDPSPAGYTSDNVAYCEYIWRGEKSSGVYFVVVHGTTSDGKKIRARTKIAIVR
jgi:hypothetical protein